MLCLHPGNGRIGSVRQARCSAPFQQTECTESSQQFSALLCALCGSKHFSSAFTAENAEGPEVAFKKNGSSPPAASLRAPIPPRDHQAIGLLELPRDGARRAE